MYKRETPCLNSGSVRGHRAVGGPVADVCMVPEPSINDSRNRKDLGFSEERRPWTGGKLHEIWNYETQIAFLCLVFYFLPERTLSPKPYYPPLVHLWF